MNFVLCKREAFNGGKKNQRPKPARRGSCDVFFSSAAFPFAPARPVCKYGVRLDPIENQACESVSGPTGRAKRVVVVKVFLGAWNSIYSYKPLTGGPYKKAHRIVGRLNHL